MKVHPSDQSGPEIPPSPAWPARRSPTKRASSLPLNFEIAAEPRALLGEGPLWDRDSGAIHWIDALGGSVFTLNLADQIAMTRHIGHPIGCVAVTRPGQLLVATDRHIAKLIETGKSEVLVVVDGDDTSIRFNDGKCDSQGRLWIGTMSPLGARPQAAAVYRIDPPQNSATIVIAGVTTSNGLGWSPDETVFYHVDTAKQAIDCFDFDPVRGSILNRRTFASIDSNLGLPDGLCVDSEGFVWLAIYGASSIYRFAPNGRLDEKIPVPVRWVTSLTFGGLHLRDLFVTSGIRRMSDEERAREPMAGRLLRALIDVPGLPSHRYGRERF